MLPTTKLPSTSLFDPPPRFPQPHLNRMSFILASFTATTRILPLFRNNHQQIYIPARGSSLSSNVFPDFLFRIKLISLLFVIGCHPRWNLPTNVNRMNILVLSPNQLQPSSRSQIDSFIHGKEPALSLPKHSASQRYHQLLIRISLNPYPSKPQDLVLPNNSISSLSSRDPNFLPTSESELHPIPFLPRPRHPLQPKIKQQTSGSTTSSPSSASESNPNSIPTFGSAPNLSKVSTHDASE